ncbi:MAG TPA: type II toxin-antitoxin system prevent-host-death family antitoxin [Alphaproteobacteria bacterium]|nr:type II toxin-antitoxin system prevent-host-death family antitoxin [Alphaproteobacteria bacterium]
MRETVSSYDAKTNLPALLRRAEKGETIVITRRGVEIAQIGPSSRFEQERRDKAFARLMDLRKKNKPSMSAKAVKALIHEGHKR